MSSVLLQKVKGKIMGKVGKTKKEGFVCELLVGAETATPEVLKIYSKNRDDFEPGDNGILEINVQLQDFCFSVE